MELNITNIVHTIAPRDYSASQAELGDNAGSITWNAAKTDAPELFPEYDRDAFIGYFRSFGAWSDEELAGQSDDECKALMLQFIASDMRECDMPDDPDNEWWETYEKECKDGSYAGRIAQSVDGGVIYYIGS